MDNLKVYVQDHGVFGSIIVIAASMEEAVAKMKDFYNFNPRIEPDVYPIEGFVWANLGDC